MADDSEEKQGGGKKKLIIFIVIGILLIAGSVGGTLFALGVIGGDDSEQMADGEMAKGEEGEGEENSEETEEGEEGEGAPGSASPTAIYIPLKPAIVVNYDSRGRQRFLQAEITLLVRSEDALAAAELHMPMVRNTLVMLFSGQIYEELQTPEGKELARQLALEQVQAIMQNEIGDDGVEQVLFTNFVMQ